MRTMISLSVAVAVLVAGPDLGLGAEREVVLPKDTAFVDVTQPPYNAKPDGQTDCTSALQEAFIKERQIYLPAGTYVVSDMLIKGMSYAQVKRTIYQGQGRDKTIIKLKDNCPGFGDPAQPREVFRMAPRDDEIGRADAFRHSVYDLTIDVGQGNPGAIGILFYCHNQGALENVRVVAGATSGYVGLDLFRALTGNCMVKNVTVEGFDYGIRAGAAVRSIVFDQIHLKGQRQYGLYNDNNCLTICGLTSDNAVPAVHNRASMGHVVLLNADLKGGSPKAAAVENVNGYMFARNVKSQGYRCAVSNRGQDVAGANVDEFVSHPVMTLFPTEPKSLNLPVENTPDVPMDPVDQWVNVFTFYQAGEPDLTQAMQRAIDSGAPTIYLGTQPPPPAATAPAAGKARGKPRGPRVAATGVKVRGAVRRIIGMEQALTADKGQPTFVVEDGAADIVVIERFASLGGVQIDTARTVVVRSVMGGGITTTAKPGKVFLEDICTGPIVLQKGKQSWIRQLDLEMPSSPNLLNDGGQASIIGFKTERGGVKVETRNGGRTEVLGGLIYSTNAPKTEPTFLCQDSAMAVSIGESSHNGNPYMVAVREVRGGESKELDRKHTYPRDGWGYAIPLYVGDAASKSSAAPSLPNVAPDTIIAELRLADDAMKGKPVTIEDRWFIRKNLVAGESPVTDRQHVISEIPDEIQGCDWIQPTTWSYQKKKPDDKVVSFKTTRDAVVYVPERYDFPGLHALVSKLPEATFGPEWKDSGLVLEWIETYNYPRTADPGKKYPSILRQKAKLFSREIKAGETLELGPGALLIAVKPAKP